MNESGVFNVTDTGSMPEWAQQALPVRVFKELHNIRDHPRLLVIIAHGFLELLVNELVNAKCKNAKRFANSRDFPHSAKLLILHELGALDDFRFRSLDWFRTLRNEAAHKPLFAVDEKELANRFNDATKASVAAVGGPHITAHGFYDFCMLLIITLWSDHSKLFSPIFFSQDAKSGKTDSQEAHTGTK